jgi:hypothetical protein
MIQKTLEKIVNTAMWWLNLALIHYVVLAGFDLPKNFALKISIFLFELFFAYFLLPYGQKVRRLAGRDPPV